MLKDSYSFTSQDRLLDASEFEHVFIKALKSSSENFTLLFRENSCGHARLGIVVAKRKAKRSVDRNLIKRIIRESFRYYKNKLPAADYIMLLKKPVSVMNRKAFFRQTNQLWENCIKK